MTDRRPLLQSEDDDDDSTQFSTEIYGTSLRSLPYSKVKEQLLPFDDPQLKRWIPGCDIRVTIVDAFYKDGKSWYVINMQHGNFKWTLKKRFEDFLMLHSILHFYRTLLTLQLPEIKFERNHSRRTSIVLKNPKVPKLPSFPLTSDVLWRKKNVVLSKISLAGYLQKVLDKPKFRQFRDTYFDDRVLKKYKIVFPASNVLRE
ncbi:PX domain-containing protein [Trichonephila clavata]|uniref:PX domain-containing protein n=1 Tax=Trichonephila clavata TaxID=2740835 RepID=A0A8X6KGA1_TRICU|nr:PX domain-containing protein [Trichonephila clavata]